MSNRPFRIRYRTIELRDLDIHLRTLRDSQQFRDDDGLAAALGIGSASWPLFGVVWAAGHVLADLMLDYDVEGRRVLEVGCGIGLASLVLNHRNADITATDHHPEAQGFLRANTGLNGDKDIPFVRTGWDDAETDLGCFDLIIGSDLLYERNHAESLAAFVDQHAEPSCEVLIVDGRRQRGRFEHHMSRRGYQCSRSTPADIESLDAPFKGQILRCKR